MRKTKYSLRRQRLIKIIASERPKSARAALIMAGYAKSTASVKAGKILNHPDVQKGLEGLGFTADKAKGAVASILYDESASAMAKIRAADLVFRILGSYAKR